MKWAISLILNNDEVIEQRVEKTLNFIFNKLPQANIYITEIDATGMVGNEMTQRLNLSKTGFSSNKDEILSAIKEPGQVLELQAQFSNSYILIVRRGIHIDLIGEGAMPSPSEIGLFKEEDLSLYNPMI